MRDLSSSEPVCDRAEFDAGVFEEVVAILGDTLRLGDRVTQIHADTALVGSMPEFDSLAVVAVVTALEDRFGMIVHDDEISADTFSTVGSLVTFVEGKVGT